MQWESSLEAGQPVMRPSSLGPQREERHPGCMEPAQCYFLSACSIYAPVKSFLRVDKEKVSFLLPTSVEVVQT